MKKISNNLWKLLLSGLVYTIILVILQVFLPGKKETGLIVKHDTAFIVKVCILTFISGMLFAWFYNTFKEGIIIKSKPKRIVFLALLVYFSSYFSQAFGLIGMHYDGQNLSSVLSKSNAFVTLKDFAGMLIIFAFISLIYKVREKEDNKVNMDRSVILSMFAGAVVFPLTMLIITKIGGVIIPSSNIIAEVIKFHGELKSMAVFDTFFYGFFALTGALVPLLQVMINCKATFKFASMYFLCIWVPIVFFMIVIDWSLEGTIIFSLESFPAICLIVYITNKIFSFKSPSVKVSQLECI